MALRRTKRTLRESLNFSGMHPDLSAFLDHLQVVQKAPLTVQRYGDVLRDLDAFTESVAPATITREMLRRFAAAPRRDGTPRAPAGVNLRLAVVRALLQFLVAERGLPANAATGLVGVREPRRTPKYLTVREAQEVVEHVHREHGELGRRNTALVVLFWMTGLRLGEVARLRAGQLDARAGLLRDVRRKGGHVLDAVLNREALASLEAYLAPRGPLDADAPLFSRRDGGSLSPRAIEALFERWRAELGWTRPLSPHVLRHTIATNLLEDGESAPTIAAVLGHQSLRTVLVYAHVQDHARRSALAKHGRHVPRSILTAPDVPSSEGLSKNVGGIGESSCVEGSFDEAA